MSDDGKCEIGKQISDLIHRHSRPVYVVAVEAYEFGPRAFSGVTGNGVALTAEQMGHCYGMLLNVARHLVELTVQNMAAADRSEAAEMTRAIARELEESDSIADRVTEGKTRLEQEGGDDVLH